MIWYRGGIYCIGGMNGLGTIGGRMALVVIGGTESIDGKDGKDDGHHAWPSSYKSTDPGTFARQAAM